MTKSTVPIAVAAEKLDLKDNPKMLAEAKDLIDTLVRCKLLLARGRMYGLVVGLTPAFTELASVLLGAEHESNSAEFIAGNVARIEG